MNKFCIFTETKLKNMINLIYTLFTPKGVVKVKCPFELKVGTEFEYGDELYKVLEITEEGYRCEFLCYI